MRTRSRLLFNLFALCLLCSGSAAQATDHRQAAQDALAQLRDALPELENDCLRLRAQLQLAELLWPRTETEARQLLEDAFKLAFKASDNPDAARREQCPAQNRLASGVEVLQRIAEHDAAWALRQVESLPETAPGAQAQALKARLRQLLAARTRAAENEQANAATDNRGAESARLMRASLFGATAETSFNQNAADHAPLNLLDTAAAQSNAANLELDAAQALCEGDFALALRLRERLGVPQARAQFRALLRFEELAATLAAGNDDEALQRALAIVDLNGRVAAFIHLATAWRSKKGAVRALEVLLLAGQTVEAEQASWEKAQALLSLAEVLIELDVERAFGLAQSAIAAFNTAAEAGDLAGQADAALGQRLSRLAQVDFKRVWELARELDNRELAWFTQLALCRGALNGA